MNLRPTRAGIKTVVRFIVARSVSTTISIIVHKNADPETRAQEAQVHIGAFVLGEMAGHAAGKYTDEMVDEAADALAKAREETPEIAQPES